MSPHRYQKTNNMLVKGFLFVIVWFTSFIQPVDAAQRHPDPDGCFSCHALEGLDYIDKNGVLRSASIDKQHYYSALHGSVPCKDCHRRIRDYPHKVENGEVDCGNSCHVEEPSEGEPYTHKAVVKEYKDSVHGNGWHKGLTGGNRFREAKEAPDPSCRFCHPNELYISEAELPKFKEAFDHLDSECGSCHQGEIWLGQFGGHILRRFIGSRWNKNDHNKMCNDCHADHKRIAKVEQKNEKTGEKEKVGPRFILASASYATTLHGRLLETNVMQGASCIDCHAPKGFRHGVLRDEKSESSTHAENLAETCAQSGCHAYATHPLNHRFVKTDLHDIDMIPVNSTIVPRDQSRLESGWVKALIALSPIIVILGGGSLLWWLFGSKKKGVTFSILGGDAFQEKMIGRKPKNKVKNKAHTKKKPTATITQKKPEDE